LLACALVVPAGAEEPPRRSTGSKQPAFEPIARVLLHPRCVNERHAHWFRVVRGNDGRGAPPLRCSTCHQSANNAASNVPGAPNWHAAPLSMAWEDKTPPQLCRALLDRSRNGNRNVDDLVDHMAHDPLVGWGWAPGGAREPVPITRAEFVELLRRWEREGAPCPG
jgi:hypothetical protein